MPLANLVRTLAALGPGLEHVASCRIHPTRFEADRAAMNAACARAFPEGARPTRACVGVTALALGALVEIEAVARRP